MSHYVCIPTRPDGTEFLGTEGVLSGDYQSRRTLCRYLLNVHGASGVTYACYNRTGRPADWGTPVLITVPTHYGRPPRNGR